MYVDLVDELRQARLLPIDSNYSVDVELQLPLSQGFGMSAAGLSALALACFEMTKKERSLSIFGLPTTLSADILEDLETSWGSMLEVLNFERILVRLLHLESLEVFH